MRMVRKTGAVFAMILAAPILSGAELITNSSFETPLINRQGWEPVYGGAQIVHDRGYDGSASIKAIPDSTTGRGGVVQRIRGFRQGAKLKFSAHIYIEKFTSGIIKPVHLAFQSRGKKHYSHVNLIYNANTKNYELSKWIKFEKELDLSEYPDVEEIAFYCLTWNLGEQPFEGVVYFDAVTVSE